VSFVCEDGPSVLSRTVASYCGAGRGRQWAPSSCGLVGPSVLSRTEALLVVEGLRVLGVDVVVELLRYCRAVARTD
jgi:hypothetical protein